MAREPMECRRRPGLRELATGVALLLAVTSRATADEIELVGEYGDSRRIAVEGAQLFTAAEIGKALSGAVEVRLAGHAQAPLAEYLRVLRESALAGYWRSGCPEAKVEVERDAQTRRIVVRCQEGPQYMTGEVRVQPADLPIAAALAAGLVERIPPKDAVRSGFHHVDDKLLAIWVDAKGKRVKPLRPFWRADKPVPFDPVAKAKLEEQTKKLLEDLGYYSAQFRLQIVPDPDRGRADLIVDITELGPAAVVGEIEITGNARNSRDAILGFLDLHVDMPNNMTLRSRVAYDLWRSARFSKCQVPDPAPPGADGKVKLVISLTEDAQAPLLDEPFSREAQAFLAVRDWLADFDRRDEDLSIHSQVGGCQFKAVLSSQHGLLLQCWVPGQATFERPPDYALVMADETCGVYSFRRSAKAATNTPWSVVAMFTLQRKGEFLFGCGIEAVGELHAFHLDQDLSPVNCPAALSKLEDEYGFKFSWEADQLTMRSDTALVRIDAASGRILELTAKSAESELEMRFEQGAYERLLKQIRDQAADMTDKIEPEHVATSLGAFLCSEAETVLTDWPIATWPKQVAAARRLFELGLLRPLDDWIVAGWPEASFHVPEADGAWGQQGQNLWINLLRPYVWAYNDRLFPRDSWCWTLSNESWLSAMGKTEYFASTLAALDAAEGSGPICHLLLAWLAKDDAAKFAEHGLERLSLNDFRNDYRPLLAREALAGEVLCQVAEALRSLDTGDAVLLGRLAPGPLSAILSSFHIRLRTDQDAPIETSLANALDGLWQNGLRDVVEVSLRAAAGKR